MKNRKVLNLRTHVGGLHGKTSYDNVKDKAEMELTPVGVVVDLPGRPTVLVPWPNCTEVILAPEDKEEVAPRGPGRPPLKSA